MKTQTLASFVWNTWKGKPATPSKFVPTSYKAQPLIKTRVAHASAKKVEKTEAETPKLRRQTQKLTEVRELISKTQHLDPCFATLWRRTI